VLSIAVGDRQFEVSVDREGLVPDFSRFDDDFLVQVSCGDARRCVVVKEEQLEPGKPKVRSELVSHVRPDPLPENGAHSLIFLGPGTANGSNFKKLQLYLAGICTKRKNFLGPMT
jgi:hypothetical protein